MKDFRCDVLQVCIFTNDASKSGFSNLIELSWKKCTTGLEQLSINCFQIIKKVLNNQYVNSCINMYNSTKLKR